jgi:hypothetical protein
MKYRLILPLALISAAMISSSCSTSNIGQAGERASEPSSSLADTSGMKKMKETERSGLGTGWGNERRSETTTRSFERASSKPAGVDSIYYNDPEGVKAMANDTEKVAGLQTAAGGLVSWGVKGALGFLPTYKESASGRRLVAGRKDSTYRIVVKNNSQRSLEIVASVDGLDVIDGQAASVAKHGYLVEGGKQLEIEGFRTSSSAIATFKFASVSNSYANLRIGGTRNVGVIGIAVFPRKLDNETRLRGAAQPFAVAP